MRSILAVMYRDYRIRTTNVAWAFWDLFVPIAYLLIFGLGFQKALGPEFSAGGQGVDYAAFFLPGVLAMATFGIAMNTSYGFFLDRDSGIFYELLTYPVSRRDFVLGKILFNILLGVAGSLLAICLGVYLLGIRMDQASLSLCLLAVVISTAGWFFFFTYFAMVIRRNDHFNTFTSVCYILLLFASSLFYPIDHLPRWFVVSALANPMTWQVDVIRHLLTGSGQAGRAVLEAGAFALFTLASFVFAVRAVGRSGS